ncbi:acyltransferase family protein [Leifsonia xyli]|uniref:acyltransferase family protein n=1 Tax=Leifsonia xyli TaxID=1575 RepID=UPI003D67209E
MLAAPRVRSAGIDAVRVLGIGAVIFGHTFRGPLTHEFLYAWHVPVFFFITGYLWTPGRTLRQEFMNRGRTLGLPYIGWFLVISLLLIADMARKGAVDPKIVLLPLLGGPNPGGTYGTFWFVSTLFFAALLYRIVERLPRPAVWAIAGVGLACGYFFGHVLAATPLAIGSAVPCLILLVVGSAARGLEERIGSPAWVGAALVLVPLVIIALMRPSPIDIKQGSFGTPVLGLVLACAISFGLILLAKSIRYPKVIGSAITELAVVGIAVVLVHPFVLAYARSFGLPTAGQLAVAVLIPWGVALLLHPTPLSAFLIGTARRRRLRRPVETMPVAG